MLLVNIYLIYTNKICKFLMEGYGFFLFLRKIIFFNTMTKYVRVRVYSEGIRR